MSAVETYETCTYAGRQGRADTHTTTMELAINGVWQNSAEEFDQPWVYNDLGDPESQIYPECRFVQCSDDITTPTPDQGYNYARGELTAVTGYAGPITYHPNGLYASIPHTSGVTVTQENDPDGMARPRSIEATRGAASLWRTGLYGFDGAGNVKRIGTSWFLYDPVSRISTGTVFTGTGGGGVQKLETSSA